jgi:predicted secreted protein
MSAPKPVPLLGVLLLAMLTPAHADNDVIFNQVFLQASARRHIENDRLQVTLAAEAQGKTPTQITGQVNEAMSWAVKKARAAGAVEVSTGSYRTYPVYRDQVIIAWRASQQLLLQGSDITALSELVGELQQRLQVKQMQFTASPEVRSTVENELIGEAMEAFKQRVMTVKKHMDGKDYRIVSLHINTGQPTPVVVREQAMAMGAQTAPSPALEAGTSEVSVTVSGSVQFY